MLARPANRMLVNMQPTVADIGFPRFVMSPRAPEGNTVKAYQQIIIIVPNLGKSGSHIGHISDKPLGRGMAYAIAWQNAAMHSGWPAIVAPSIDVASVNACSQLFKIIPKQFQALVRFFQAEDITENDKSVVTQILQRFRVTGIKARRVLIADVDIILQNACSHFL